MKIKLILLTLIMILLVSCRNEKKEYFPDGKLKAIYTLKDGKKNGKYIEYYPSGAIHIEANYVDGLLQGEKKTYYENGRLKMLNQYLNNKWHDFQEFYNADGRLDSICSYVLVDERYVVCKDVKTYFKLIDSFFNLDDTTFRASYENTQVVFDKSGRVIPKKSHWFDILMDTDTIQMSDSLQAYVDFRYGLNGRQNKYQLFYFPSHSKENLIRIELSTGNIKFKVKPMHKGLNYLNGYIEEYTPYGNDTMQALLFFRKRYYVR